MKNELVILKEKLSKENQSLLKRVMHYIEFKAKKEHFDEFEYDIVTMMLDSQSQGIKFEEFIKVPLDEFLDSCIIELKETKFKRILMKLRLVFILQAVCFTAALIFTEDLIEISKSAYLFNVKIGQGFLGYLYFVLALTIAIRFTSVIAIKYKIRGIKLFMIEALVFIILVYPVMDYIDIKKTYFEMNVIILYLILIIPIGITHYMIKRPSTK